MLSRQQCEQYDQMDELRAFRDAFSLPDEVIYLDGNSLGPLPKAAVERVASCVQEEWGEGLIRSWNQAGWWHLPRTLGDRIAPLIGAESGEVLVADTISVNLFKLLCAALQQRSERRVIVSEADNFPTDLYIAQGIAQWYGDVELRLLQPGQEPANVIDEQVALVLLTHVNYRTGRLWDMPAITAQTQQAGALSIWDLAHSAGALPVDLNHCGVDYAVGCTYKYLNAGPGAPAFVFAAKCHQATIQQPLNGWWGHARPFDFDPQYTPAEGIERLLVGTQPILSFAALDASLALWEQVDMQAVRAKSQALTALFIDLIEQECADYGLQLASPRSAEQRGSQVSWQHPDAYAIMQALIARGVIGDFRAPDILRFGFAPLYIRFTDVWDAVQQLKVIVVNNEWQQAKFQQRSTVT